MNQHAIAAERILWETDIPAGAHWSGLLRRGVALRMIDLEGSANLAAVFYNQEEKLERYNMADEYLDLVCRLWDSWEADAVVRDVERGVYVDHTKVHTVDFRGKYYKSRGPLNTVRPPQGRPVLCQAGASPKGRQFAAKYADTIISRSQNPADMKAFRDDVRTRMEAIGRKPDDCKVLFMIAPLLGETEELAQQHKRRRAAHAAAQIKQRLAFFGKLISVDFSSFDLDKPISQYPRKTPGER